MADREKVIRGLECHSEPHFGIDECFCETCPYDELTCGLDVPADALSLLKAQEPRAMTLEEAGEADVCWLEIRDSDRMQPCRVNIHHDCFSVRRFSQIPETLPKEEYGRLCRCWTSRPTDEQRKAATWTC